MERGSRVSMDSSISVCSVYILHTHRQSQEETLGPERIGDVRWAVGSPEISFYGPFPPSHWLKTTSLLCPSQGATCKLLKRIRMRVTFFGLSRAFVRGGSQVSVDSRPPK